MGKNWAGRAAIACVVGAFSTSASAQVLELAVDASPSGLDPHIATAFASLQVVNGTIYEGLTAIDEDLRVVPGLAESWEISDDGTTYTFTLREGMTFHDGSPVEAADVIASYNRVRADAIGSPLASRVAAIEGMEAPDPRTVVLTLAEPSAPLLASLSSIAIVPRTFEDDAESLQREPVGTGPFRFDEWVPNGHIAMSAYDGYWEADLPYLDGVEVNIVPESATRQVGLVSGQYHMLPNIDPATALQLQGQPGVEIAETLELAYSLIGMNVTREPLGNPAVREAINTALNRQDIVDAALFGAGVPAGPLSPALTDWAADAGSFPCYAADPEQARQILADAGVETPVELELLVLPRQDIRDIAQVVQQQLEAAGFEVTLNIPELGTFVQNWRNSDFDLFASVNAGSIDPDDYFYRTFRTGGSTNVFQYSNEDVDSLLDTGRSTTDMAERQSAYGEVQSILACNGPAAFLTYGQLFTAMADEVEGFDIIANRSLQALRSTSLAQ